jgi:hypothetical protein
VLGHQQWCASHCVTTVNPGQLCIMGLLCATRPCRLVLSFRSPAKTLLQVYIGYHRPLCEGCMAGGVLPLDKGQLVQRVKYGQGGCVPVNHGHDMLLVAVGSFCYLSATCHVHRCRWAVQATAQLCSQLLMSRATGWQWFVVKDMGG